MNLILNLKRIFIYIPFIIFFFAAVGSHHKVFIIRPLLDIDFRSININIQIFYAGCLIGINFCIVVCSPVILCVFFIRRIVKFIWPDMPVARIQFSSFRHASDCPKTAAKQSGDAAEQ